MNEHSSSAKKPKSVISWQELHKMIHPALASAPQLDWSEIDRRSLGYLLGTVSEMLWLNHLAFLVAVLTSYARLDAQTIVRDANRLHARWHMLFPRYQIKTFDEWQPEEHIARYIADTQIADTAQTRQSFLRTYASVAHHSQAYLRSLLPQEREVYQQWGIPPLAPEVYQRLSRAGEIRTSQQQRRKKETDAITPHFAQLRGEAHFRWNQLQRLRTKFAEAVSLVQSGKDTLPLAFSYEEPRDGCRLHFLLWDRISFVLNHAEQYQKGVLWDVRHQVGTYRPEQNHYFLEFVRAEPLREGFCETQQLLWFGDLLRYDLFCCGPLSGSEDEVKRKQEYLWSWGYGPKERVTPFRTGIAGLLAWSKTRYARFLVNAQRKTSGLLLLVEPLFTAATFGLAALDMFTTTGARMNELLQISLSPECLHTVVVEGSQRLVVRLVPKGTDKLADYIVGPETQRNFEKVAALLQVHYQLKPGEAVPSVPFNPMNGRSHRFPPRPYLFQLGKRHFSQEAITGCLRFLSHGLVFQTSDGQTVTLKAHTLRHVFATHIHHVEHIPLDIVAVILHQKDVKVTGYYAAPTQQQVIATADSLLDRFATHLGNVHEAFLRAPQELREQFEEARQRVGTLAKIPGGYCTCHAICPVSFACTGCAFNVPDPQRRHEIVEQKAWTFVRLEQVKRQGLGPETVKMQALLRQCDMTLEEMTMMEQYRKDEIYDPPICIEDAGE
jgi:hypothetical protein